MEEIKAEEERLQQLIVNREKKQEKKTSFQEHALRRS